MHRFLLPLLLLLALPSAAWAQQPVDTRQFGLLARGMSPAIVEARLGPPAVVEALPPVIVTTRPRTLGTRQRSFTSCVVARETWLYPGDSGIPATRLLFHNGTLVEKSRLR